MMIYKLLTRTPILGLMLEIANSYVADGDFSADHGFAPLSYWVKGLWAEILASASLTILILWPSCSISCYTFSCSFSVDAYTSLPGAVATSVLPNILGFGIGVYALVFALSSNLVKQFNDKAKEGNKKGDLISILALNSVMAYPLMIIATAISIGVIQQANKETQWLVLTCWFFFWYSIVVTIALIGNLFSMGSLSLLDKIEE